MKSPGSILSAAVVAATAILFVHSAIAQDKTMSLFGVSLGDRLPFSECPIKDIVLSGGGKSTAYDFEKTSKTCFGWDSLAGDNKGKKVDELSGKAIVFWPKSGPPLPAKKSPGGSVMLATIVNGKVEGLQVKTAGMSTHVRDLELLTEQFGKPLILEQIAAGGFNALWKHPSALGLLKFRSNIGEIEFVSQVGAQANEQARRSNSQSVTTKSNNASLPLEPAAARNDGQWYPTGTPVFRPDEASRKQTCTTIWIDADDKINPHKVPIYDCKW